MDELDKKSKRLLIIFIVVYAIILLAVLIYIWTPKKVKKQSDINKYSTVEYKDNMAKRYISDFCDLIAGDDKTFYEKISPDFLDKNNLTQSNFREFLKTNYIIGDNIVMNSYTLLKQEEKNIYRISCNINGINRYVIITESKPYEYTISFEQDTIPNVTSNAGNTTDLSEGIKFKVEELERKTTNIRYKVTITNENEFDVAFNFDDINNVVLVLSDGNTYRVASTVISMDENNTLSKGSSVTKEFFFSVSSEKQAKISKLRFRNVSFGENTKNIDVNI